MSQASCDQIWQVITDNETSIRELLSDQRQEVIERFFDLLGPALAGVEELEKKAELPVSQWDVVIRWMDGLTIKELGDEFGLDDDGVESLGKYVALVFENSLPWVIAAFQRLALEALGVAHSDITPWVRSLPTMVKFGVPSPESAWAMAIGIQSRGAAVRLSEAFRAEAGAHNGSRRDGRSGPPSLSCHRIATQIHGTGRHGPIPTCPSRHVSH